MKLLKEPLLHFMLIGAALGLIGFPVPGVELGIAVSAVALDLVVMLRSSWHRIFARVLGSWAAAIGLLALAWKLKPDSS